MLITRFRKKWLIIVWLLCLLLCSYSIANAQYFDLKKNKKRIIIPFRMIRNMIIIKLNINNRGPFNFILDSGIGLMLITKPELIDSVNIASKSIIKIPGFGDGENNEAYLTSALNIGIDGLESHDVNAAVLKKDLFNLSSFAGLPIDGLMGYDFFSNLAVKINFTDTTLTVCKPENLHGTGRYEKIPISIEERKAYINAVITFPNGELMADKLVVDIGAGHAISIENMIKNNSLPQKTIPANLGIGLNGQIEGCVGRINKIEIGKFRLTNVIASFPDNTKQRITMSVKRDGNLGMGILKKFDVIFDYPENTLFLKPNDTFKEPFKHDMSGLQYYSSADCTHVIISRVEAGSAADDIGLERGDEIVAVNFKPVAKMTLEELDHIFESRDNRSILLEIYHDKEYDQVILTLKQRI
jgi:hypothetical protein